MVQLRQDAIRVWNRQVFFNTALEFKTLKVL
jgi:hypothetical protein